MASATSPYQLKSIEGLSGVLAKPPQRVLVRLRSSDSPLSAWRLEVTSREGSGAIVLVEPSPTESFYRGEGAFLGWSQRKLASIYRALISTSQATFASVHH